MKIAFLFMVRDNLSQTEIWQKFFADAPQSDAIILTHAKYPERSTDPIVKASVIKHYVKTEWGHPSLSLVMIYLALEALKRGAERLIYLSETCVPLQPYNHIHDFLSQSPLSWFQTKYMKPYQLDYRYNSLTKPQYIKRSQLKKSSQWCILNRQDAKVIVSTFPKYFPNYIHFKVPDEHYIITTLFHHYKGKYRFNDGMTTLTDWIRRTKSTKHPHTFYKLNKEDVRVLINTNSLFGRKFDSTSNIGGLIPILWKRNVTIDNISKDRA